MSAKLVGIMNFLPNKKKVEWPLVKEEFKLHKSYGKKITDSDLRSSLF